MVWQRRVVILDRIGETITRLLKYLEFVVTGGKSWLGDVLKLDSAYDIAEEVS